ncbi:MAG: SulP family inorganic anion transporter [Magnetococcales bacterium]|nr:SulP family inorganic anion transporter [Magnetococcales bacterium]
MAWAEVFPFRRWMPRVNRKTLRQDLFAGLTGAVIVLPQGVAFAAIAGLPPQFGLYTAMIPAIIAALFGSSHHLVSGPTTAISIVVYSTLAPMATPGSDPFIGMALTLAIMVGLFQLALGLARMGTLVNFVSHSVVVGFTSGAAILIASSQLKHFLGIELPGGLSFVATLHEVFIRLPDANLSVVLTGSVTLGIAVVLRIVAPRWPGMLIAMVGGSVTALVLGGEDAGIQLVGALPASLPPLSSPTWDAKIWSDLASGALAIALLGLIEAVSIARSVSLQSRQRINGNQEFIGQGLSNIVGSFFSSYPSSGSFTRSGVNFRAGAQTPISAVFAAVPLMLIVLLIAPLAAYLPIAAMAGVILLVAYNLIEFHHIRMIVRTSESEAAVMVVTFGATLLLHLELAIYVGVMLSLVIYLSKAAAPRIVSLVPNPNPTGVRHLVHAKTHKECPQLKIVAIEGALFFGAVNHVEEILHCMTVGNAQQKQLLIVSSGINFIDVAGVEMLRHEAEKRHDKGGNLFLCAVRDQVMTMFKRSGHIKHIGSDKVFRSKSEAIRTIVTQHLDREKCKRCDHGVFFELECVGSGDFCLTPEFEAANEVNEELIIVPKEIRKVS